MDLDVNLLLNLLYFVIFGLSYSFVCFVEDDIHAREGGIVTLVPAMPTFLITVYMVKPVSLVLNLPVIPVFAWYQSYVQSVSQLISSQLSLSISLCILFVLLLK